jgi:hypothetical protein
MDVACATCGEPWDIHHLRHDEVHETQAGTEQILRRLDQEEYGEDSHLVRPYEGEAWKGDLTPFWRSQFAANGWEFGSSIYAVLRCNCCEDTDGEELDVDAVEARRGTYEMISDLLAGDDDGVAASLAITVFRM